MNAESYCPRRSACAGLQRWFPLLVLLASLLLGCADNPEIDEEPIWSLSGATMGTHYNVSIVGGDEAGAQRLQQRIDGRLAEVNRRMSTYDPDSELSRFNSSVSAEWFAVSAETASVAESALALSEASGGAFDPTVGPLVNLWGFGPADRRFEPPTDEAIAAAKAAVGHRLVEARLEPPALRKTVPGVYLDLSAIAKGHGVDAIAELIAGEGRPSFMVEIGGEVRAQGTKPGGKPWRIGVEKPDEPLRSADGKPRLQRVVELADLSMATSGDYRNFFESGGVRFSHTIDPQTGRPVTHHLATSTVLAGTCREADGLATTLLVLGPTAGYDWAVEHNVAALLISRDGADELTERTTPAWDTLNADQPAKGAKP